MTTDRLAPRPNRIRPDLDPLLFPAGVAIVGRVDRTQTAAGLQALHGPRFGDRWHLVNPKGGSVDGVPVHPSLADVPAEITLAVISTPPATVAGLIEECGAAGIPFALVFSSGFSEVGPDGAALEQELGEVARRAGVRILGPNTNTNTFEPIPEPAHQIGGRIGVVTQSGYQGRPVVNAARLNVALTRQVPCGNEVDLDVCDFIEWFAGDEGTTVIAGYIEGFRSIERLGRALQACNDAGKPVVLIKIGSSEAGARMASSHTGHLTGSDAIIDGLFAQHGVVRVRDLDELIETSALLAKLPPGTGGRAALYAHSGGTGTHMAEMCELAGVPLAALSAATQDALHEHIPAYLSVANPVDNGGTFLLANGPDIRQGAIRTIAEDPDVDYVVVGLTGAFAAMTDRIGADVRALADSLPVPLLATWNDFNTDEQGFDDLVASGIPLFRSFRGCFGALRAHLDHQAALPTFRHRAWPDTDGVVLPALPAGATTLVGPQASGLLAAVGIPDAPEHLARSADEAGRLAATLGGHVAMKVVSADLPHRSDAGLVALAVAPADAETTYDELVDRARTGAPGASIDGVSVQAMVRADLELLVGMVRDPVLGPAVTVGVGGLFTEVLADAAVCPLPLDADDVRRMLASLRAHPLLVGARGRPPVDLEAVVDVVLAVATLTTALGERLLELDLNPLMATADGVVAVDALVVLGPEPDVTTEETP